MQAFSHFVPKYSHYNGTNLQTVSESVCVCPSSNIVFTTFQLLLSDDFVHQSNKQLSQAAALKMKTRLVNINPSCSRQVARPAGTPCHLLPVTRTPRRCPRSRPRALPVTRTPRQCPRSRPPLRQAGPRVGQYLPPCPGAALMPAFP